MRSDSGSNIPLPTSMKVSDWVKLLTEDFTPDDLDTDGSWIRRNHYDREAGCCSSIANINQIRSHRYCSPLLGIQQALSGITS